MRYVSDPPAFTYSTSQSECYIVVVVCRFPKDHCNRTILWSSMCFCLVAYAHVKIVCIICFSGGSLQTTAYTVHDGQSTNTVPWWNVAHLYIRLDFAYRLTLFSLTIPIIMPRRPPPSALRLFQGPLPPRSEPKHRLPSVPSPTFYPKGALPRQLSPPPRVQPVCARMACTEPTRLSLDISGSSPTSNPCCATKRRRGPWDDSSSVDLRVDVDSLLAVPKPVVVCVS